MTDLKDSNESLIERNAVHDAEIARLRTDDSPAMCDARCNLIEEVQ